jgi:hypothetical protein
MDYYTKNDKGEYVKVTEPLHSDADVQTLKTDLETQKKKVKEFRENNENLRNQNENLDAVSKVLGGLQNVSAEGLTTKINEVADEKAKKMTDKLRETHENTVKDLTSKYNKSRTSLSSLTLRNEVVSAVGDTVASTDALDDLYNRAAGSFEVNDEGNVVAKNNALDAAGQPLTLKTWAGDLQNKSKHLFKQPNGPIVRGNPRTPSTNPTEPPANPFARLSAGIARVPITKK